MTPPLADLADPLGDQLGPDRLGVDLLEPLGRAGRPRRSAASSSRTLVGSSYRVHRPSTLSTPRPPSWPSATAEAGLIVASDGCADAGDLERVRVELPGGGHVVDVPGAPARHDRDVVQVVAALRGLAHPDLDHVTHEGLQCFDGGGVSGEW